MDAVEFKNELVDAIGVATGKFSPLMRENKRKSAPGIASAEKIFTMAQEFECERLYIDIDEETAVLNIRIECYDAVMESGASNDFFSVIQLADMFEFFPVQDVDKICIRLSFGGLWERGA